MREVVLLCGPPGAGKSTAARASGLPVFDRDDAQWSGEAEFRAAIARLAGDPQARGVVIRSGATSSARQKAAALIGATRVFVLLADRDMLVRRILRRGRRDAQSSLAAVNTWFTRFERDDGVQDFPGWLVALAPPPLGVVSEEW